MNSSLKATAFAVAVVGLGACGGGGGGEVSGDSSGTLGFSATGVASYVKTISMPGRDMYYSEVQGDRIYSSTRDDVVEIRDKQMGSLLYSVSNSGNAHGFGLDSNVVYVVDSGMLKVVDTTSNFSSVVLGQVGLQLGSTTQMQCIKQVSTNLYLIGSDKHWVIDVSQPNSPQIVSEQSVSTAGTVSPIYPRQQLCANSANTLIVRQGNGVGFFDISVPSQITRTDTFPTTKEIMAWSDGYLYVTAGGDNLVEVYQASQNVLGPKIAQIAVHGVRSMSVANGILAIGVDYVTDNIQGNWVVYDVTTPSSPILLDYGDADGDGNSGSNYEGAWILTDGYSMWVYQAGIGEKVSLYSINRLNTGGSPSAIDITGVWSYVLTLSSCPGVTLNGTATWTYSPGGYYSLAINGEALQSYNTCVKSLSGLSCSESGYYDSNPIAATGFTNGMNASSCFGGVTYTNTTFDTTNRIRVTGDFQYVSGATVGITFTR